MKRGRKPREGESQRPRCGFYRSYVGVLDAVREGRITPPAAHLWQVIQAHSRADGYCEMTDVELGEHMGGIPRGQVYRLRASLRAAGLLEEVSGPPGSNRRRLVPLSGPGMDRTEPRVNARQMDRAQPRVNARQMDQAEPRVNARQMDRAEPRVNARQMDRASKREEEEEVDINLKLNQQEPPLPPPEGPARAADGAAAARPDTRRAAEGETAAGPDARPAGGGAGDPEEEQALAGYMVELGVFPHIAARLAPGFLARQDLAEAQAEVLAWWLSVSEGAGRPGQPGSDDERLRGRLVTRLRVAADGRLSPPECALRKARRSLIALHAQPVPGDGGPEPEQAGAAAQGGSDPPAYAGLPEPGPGATGPAPKAADEPLGLPGSPELSGQAAWELAQAQLSGREVWRFYSPHLAGSRCARVEVAGARPRLVIEVGQPTVAAWLNQDRTGRTLAIRHLQTILGQEIEVWFEG